MHSLIHLLNDAFMMMEKNGWYKLLAAALLPFYSLLQYISASIKIEFSEVLITQHAYLFMRRI